MAYEPKHYESVSWAVFNSTDYDARLGRKAVRAKYGKRGLDRLKKIIVEGGGIMAIFQVPPTLVTKLFAETVGMGAERRAERRAQRHEGKRMSECYYDNELCEGELWECQTCHQEFCQTHFHSTDKGTNVECVGCEGERKEAQEEEGVEEGRLVQISGTLNDDQFETLGEGFISLLDLKKIRSGNDAGRVRTTWGTKTPQGLAKTVLRVVEDFIESGETP
jgi:hypothetical protein